MNKEYEQRRQKVEEFYQTHSLVLIGMNDYANSSFLTNSLLKMIEKEINAASLTIDAGSLTLNKSEHIDIMLEHNLTLEEIKIAQLISLHDGVSNLIKENAGSKTQSKIDEFILKPLFNPIHAKTSEMDKIGISDLIKNSDAPLIIHSTGANNLMRILGENPYTLESDYKNNRNRYTRAIMKSLDESTIPVVLDGIKRNFENIYALNPNAQIFSLGLYLQKVFKKERYKIFKSLILRYNEELEKLCSQYNVNYIETMVHGDNHQNHLIDFSLSKKGQKELAKSIIQELFMYLDSVGFNPVYKENNKEINYALKEDLVSEYGEYLSDSTDIDEKLKEEREREKKIYEKALLETRRRNL